MRVGFSAAAQDYDGWQPFSALFTAATISSTVIFPLPLASPAGHDESGAVPSAMFTIFTTSPTVASPSPLQLPTHVLSVSVGVLVTGGCVGVLVGVGVEVAVGVRVAHGPSQLVRVRVSVPPL